MKCCLQGIEHIKNEVEDLSEPLIDGIHGHGRYNIENMPIFGIALIHKANEILAQLMESISMLILLFIWSVHTGLTF